MSVRVLVLVVAAMTLASPLFAGDIVAMPTGNTVQPGNVELNGIYWNWPPTNGPADSIVIGEVFVGIIDRVELDLLYADVRDDIVFGPGIDTIDDFFELNIYVTLLKEGPKTPSLIVGCTNVLGSDWLGGAVRDAAGTLIAGNPDYDDPSFFALTSYNLVVPKGGPPSWKSPLIRGHLGWGNKWHENEFFGGVQAMIHPNWGGAILNYKSMPAYMVTWKAAKWLELTGGSLDGDTFYRVGGFLSW